MLATVLLTVYGSVTSILIIRTSERDKRKEALINRLNNKVLQYRLGVAELNATSRKEKDDDHVI